MYNITITVMACTINSQSDMFRAELFYADVSTNDISDHTKDRICKPDLAYILKYGEIPSHREMSHIMPILRNNNGIHNNDATLADTWALL